MKYTEVESVQGLRVLYKDMLRCHTCWTLARRGVVESAVNCDAAEDAIGDTVGDPTGDTLGDAVGHHVGAEMLQVMPLEMRLGMPPAIILGDEC